MSSLLRPVNVEFCPTTLREHRRSSVNSCATVPGLLSTSYQLDDPVLDESDHGDSPTITVLSNTSSLDLTAVGSELCIPDQGSDDDDNKTRRSLSIVSACDDSNPSSTSTSGLPSPKNSVADLPTVGYPEALRSERLRWRLASAFFAYFMCGWGDGVTGTVLPYFMEDFHISYMMSSLLYAGSTVGFLTGTLLVESIISKLGRFDSTSDTWSSVPQLSLIDYIRGRNHPSKKTGFSPSQAKLVSLLVASILHGLFFVVMGCQGGFWTMFFAYALAAFARAILTSTLNEYFAAVSLRSIGYAYGMWSFGGVVSPLICQSLIATGVPWNHFYFGSLVLSAFNTLFLVSTFRPTASEHIRDCAAVSLSVEETQNDKKSARDDSIEKDISSGSHSQGGRCSPKDNQTLILAIRQPYQWALCIFALLYCGCETTTQGLIVSYLLGTRNANPDTVGYVSSGFWGGITISRVLLGRYSPKLTSRQRKFVVLGCICIGLAMQILIFLVKSTLVNSIATAIIGLTYGPVFPSCLSLANDLLPSEIRMVSMALISAIASIGASFFPFLVGTISNTQGIHILPYVTVPLASVIACLWTAFPTKRDLPNADRTV